MSRRLLPLLSLVLAVAACSDAAVVATPLRAPKIETDEPAAFALELATPEGVRSLGVGHGAALLADGRAVIVDEQRKLRLDGRVLLDGVLRAPVALHDGRLLAARTTDLGQSDLWLVTTDGRPPRAIAAAPGADTLPFVLEDRREVLFVSDRSGVASLWSVSLDGGAPRQLTNVASRPGQLGADFVPSPNEWVRQEGSRVIYDAGDAGDALWFFDVDTGLAGAL